MRVIGGWLKDVTDENDENAQLANRPIFGQSFPALHSAPDALTKGDPMHPKQAPVATQGTKVLEPAEPQARCGLLAFGLSPSKTEGA